MRIRPLGRKVFKLLREGLELKARRLVQMSEVECILEVTYLGTAFSGGA